MQRRTEVRTTELHLRQGGTSVVLDTSGPGLPSVVHWGPDLGELSAAALAGVVLASRAQRTSGAIDEPARLTLLPLESDGWQGTPGLLGSRAGASFSPAFTVTALDVAENNGDSDSHEEARNTTETGVTPGSDSTPGSTGVTGTSGTVVTITAADPAAELGITITLRLDPHGLLHQRLRLTNTAAGSTGDDARELDASAAAALDTAATYELGELAASFPLPHTAGEVLDTTGRHLRERTPQRHDLTIGRYDRESRRGRPGADATLLVATGTPGFGFERGLVHAAHLAWSGNHRVSVERLVTGATHTRVAELLAPGEIRLGPGESYETPEALGSWGDGLTELSARFHRLLRARPNHPATPRPVTLNTWEAVYFDHDLGRLSALADAGARVGIERFVLDDGWFHGRRDDTTSLGDWWVDETVWPDGLAPIIDHVTDLGMQFGIWVEPEMVSPDSELARAHPEWILGPGEGRLPAIARQQQVLDLSNPDAFAYILGKLDALLTDHDIAYLKWDHNRDLLEAGAGAPARPAVHENVVALYRLLDELRSRHPGVEIESCASGGARVDLGILDHTDRIWTSDCIDPIERLVNQKHTGLLVPSELMGAHVSGPRSHSTGRRHDLSFRAGVALPGHFGVEWDISSPDVDDATLDELAAWIAVHKAHRSLLHTGVVVHADLPDPGMDLRGVVAADRSRALYTFTQVATSASYPAGPVTLPGLDDDREYRVALAAPTATLGGPGQSPLAWALDGVVLTGRALRLGGVQAPVLFPEQLVLLEATAL
ncbi:alpha-galactosidase [Frigoribacterium sp. PhB116]|uniref:alpha-galactosidase n=1 Tax=Frigoribacterium sp. PhB116 TaxID=2485174 RepID=UPI00105CFD79|nr:alpha-galactosidase [Frigoribacterium sp. PhB116]TDT61724.1 alpha-galactosidase [Frigoribacterium sp. PhB116]